MSSGRRAHVQVFFVVFCVVILTAILYLASIYGSFNDIQGLGNLLQQYPWLLIPFPVVVGVGVIVWVEWENIVNKFIGNQIKNKMFFAY